MITLRKTTLVSVAGAFLLGLAMPSGAQPYYGSQLMTPEKWAKHRATMWSPSRGEREVSLLKTSYILNFLTLLPR